MSLRVPSWRAVWAAAGTRETGREGFLQGCEESPTMHWGELAGYERFSWACLIPAKLGAQAGADSNHLYWLGYQAQFHKRSLTASLHCWGHREE